MSGNYRVAPLFLIRVAGVSFESLHRLATTTTAKCARELVVARDQFQTAKAGAEELLRSRDNAIPEALFRSVRRSVRAGNAVVEILDPCPPALFDYTLALAQLREAEESLSATLPRETNAARSALLESARATLPRYLIFAGGGTLQLLDEIGASESGAEPGLRNKAARARERHLLLYLQRIAGKNDTFSEFGPSGWGCADAGPNPLDLVPDAAIAKRDTFLERWTAHALAAAMNSDPAVYAEIAPRLNPNGILLEDAFVFVESGEVIPLEAPDVKALRACDGRTPAHALELSAKSLHDFTERKILRWQVEVPALDPHAFEQIERDIEAWRAGETKQRWQNIVAPLRELQERFALAEPVGERARILASANEQLRAIGAARKPGERFLYAATNPIGEECYRECHFTISQKLLDEVAHEAAPWIDLWRDSYAFVAGRVATGLRGVLQQAPVKDGALPLPAFLRLCDSARLPLTGPGIVALAHIAFQELKAAFRERMKDRPDAPEWALTAEDCAFVRDNFEFEKFDEYTYPSADLQLAATSAEAVARGNYEWIVGELHPPAAILHHGGYWSCPDHPALSRALASTTFGKPAFHFGFFAADFTSHTTVRAMDALPELTNFIAPQRPNPKWRYTAPAEAEVHVEESSGDVCVRRRGSHEHLGSFARAWLIPLGFHPFNFGRAPHMPRLRCGKVVVQRRSWTVTNSELGAGDFTGVSRDLVLAIERLRTAKGWPRHIYIRPSEQALRRSGAEGRDKDTKPVFIDLESYLFLEIFHRWLTKAGELEVTEMLPDPSQLLWREGDGRRTFELRTLIVPG